MTRTSTAIVDGHTFVIRTEEREVDGWPDDKVDPGLGKFFVVEHESWFIDDIPVTRGEFVARLGPALGWPLQG